MTELWFRNPAPYMNELKEVSSEFRVVWDIAYLSHYDYDPFPFMCMNFGLGGNWHFMVVYTIERYAIIKNNRNRVIGIHPVWDASVDDPELLIDYMTDIELLKSGQSPIENQEHRVIITGLDALSKWKQIVEISEIQKLYPDVKIHIFNTYSYQAIFGMGFYSGDFNPKDNASGGIMLQSGRQVREREYEDAVHWINSLGFTIAKLKASKSNRLKFNIISAIWASVYFNELPSFKKSISYVPLSSAVGWEVLKRRTPHIKTGLSVQESDQKACDYCTLWKTCRYFREGSVCMMPDNDYEAIANALGTRDAATIANGIARLLQVNVERIKDARDAEKAGGDAKKKFIESLDSEEDVVKVAKVFADGKSQSTIDPELTKLIDSTIKNGVALANLHKVPEGKGRVVINLTPGASASVTTGSSSAAAELTAGPAVTRELAARAVAELEAKGVKREDLTEEMINQWLAEQIVEGAIE